MVETPGLDMINGLLAFVSAIFLFAAAAYSMFIGRKMPPGKYSVIFPYLTMGSFLLGMMMISFAGIFISDNTIVTPMTTVLFFLGTSSMMVGAYKVTKEFGIEETKKAMARAPPKSKVAKEKPQEEE